MDGDDEGEDDSVSAKEAFLSSEAEAEESDKSVGSNEEEREEEEDDDVNTATSDARASLDGEEDDQRRQQKKKRSKPVSDRRERIAQYYLGAYHGAPSALVMHRICQEVRERGFNCITG